MEKILSIIIPTYNMEKYLRRCLDSLIVKENLEMLEVWVVNDGSKDGSSAIAHEYADKYPSVFNVIDKQNGNYGSCINAALPRCTGKYVKVLDSDDWYDTESLNNWIKRLANTGTDAVLTNCNICHSNGKIKNLFLDYEDNQNLDTSIDVIKYFCMHHVAYKMSIFKDLDYKQTEGVSYTDQEWIFYPMFNVKSAIFHNECIYQYAVGREGQTIEWDTVCKRISTLTSLITKMLSTLAEKKLLIPASLRKYAENVLEAQIGLIYQAELIFNDKKDFHKDQLIALDKQIKQYDEAFYKKTEQIKYKGIDYVKIFHRGGVLEDALTATPLDSGDTKRKTYILDILEESLQYSQIHYVASSKPRYDTTTSICEIGATLLEICTFHLANTTNRFKRKVLGKINRLDLIRQAGKKCKEINNSTVFVQYPFYWCSSNTAKYILDKLKDNDNKLIFIVHDINSVRVKGDCKEDRQLLSYADVAVVHSPQMGQALHKIIEKDLAVIPLEFFDYRSKINNTPQKSLRKINLIFAGNLIKAPFIKSLSNLPLSEDFQINLYGKESPLVKESQYVHYKGKFSAEEFGDIEGNWGLVWDGESINTCSGEYGEYLRLNAPFKFSLYLAACRPVVVWRQSAMAQYVEKQHLGICVDSLSDIPMTISNLSDDELKEISKSVSIVSEGVKNGHKLQQASLKAINMLNNL